MQQSSGKGEQKGEEERKKPRNRLNHIKQQVIKRCERKEFWLLKHINHNVNDSLLRITQLPEGNPEKLRYIIDTILSKELQRTLIKRLRKKERFKTIFFILTMLLLVSVVIGACFIVWFLVQRENPKENAAAIITAIGGLVITLLGLPTIIANYLFDKDEDEPITRQLLNIRDNDLEQRLQEMKQEENRMKQAAVEEHRDITQIGLAPTEKEGLPENK